MKRQNAKTPKRRDLGSVLRACGGGVGVLVIAGVIGLVFGSAGCMQPEDGGTVFSMPKSKSSAEEREPPLESNIVRVTKFFSAEPWLSFTNDGSGRVNGFKCSVFLEGPGKARGVFGSGTLVVCMYRVDRDGAGREVATPLQEWELPPDKAYPWRCKKPTLMGWGYGLRLQWRDDLDLEGRQIAVLVKYVRDDGQVISATRQVMKVPRRGTQMLTVQGGEEPRARN